MLSLAGFMVFTKGDHLEICKRLAMQQENHCKGIAVIPTEQFIFVQVQFNGSKLL